jgi:predicted phage-related endonuclease
MENYVTTNGKAIEASTHGSKVVVYSNSEIDELLHEIAMDRAEKKAIEVHESKMKERLMKIVGDVTDILNEYGDSDATWNEIKTERFETKKFQVDFPELYSAYIKESFDKRLVIKKVW